MPLTNGFNNGVNLQSLRPMPLSQNTICGGCFVLRPNGTPIRVSELAMSKPNNHVHRVLGPDGEIAVRIQIGAFGSEAYALRMRESNGQIVSFMTSIRHVRLNSHHLIEVQPCQVYNGLRFNNGVKEYDHLEVLEVRRITNYAHYSYSLDPCALFIGAGRRPVFLPFEVT